jgi:FkbM family methyltransferase
MNKTYTGGKYKIFFPTKSKNATTTHHYQSASAVEECIQEWKDNQIEYQGNGMSAWKEDMIIFDAFFRNDYNDHNDDELFYYMEIGGHNGVLESNTRFYDVCLGWQGLLVEPTPRNYERMVKLRPNAHHLNVAPSCNTSDVVMFQDHWYTNAVMNEEGSTLAIHCGPLSYYIEQLGITHIHFWSLDVEGAELSVLQTVDFNAVQIDVIMAESENRLADKAQLAQDVRLFLHGKDYILMKSVKVNKSDIFLHKSACVRYNNFPECQNLV